MTYVVLGSKNAKTGNVAASTFRTQDACPPWCPLWGRGCYAENRMGRPSPFDLAERYGIPMDDDYTPLITTLASLRPNSVVRFNVSGDYLRDDKSPDMGYIEATNHAHGHDVLSYTHAWQVLDPKWFEDDTRPNASCDSLMDVVKARDLGWSTVIVDPGGEYPQGTKMEGTTFVTCPYETPSKRQCIDCRLCARGNRPSTVVFPVHGARKRAAAEALKEVMS
jgi:hypothetical protein